VLKLGSGETTLNLLHAALTVVMSLASAENLEQIDVALIDSARHEIDIAAYVLADWPIMQALSRG
jgi:phosphatidylserine/phosphatidylglycerophosphate/cardiolipin synthase-like enzyme